MNLDLFWVLDSLEVYLVVDKLLSVKSIFSLNLVSKRGTWVTPVAKPWEGFAQLADTILPKLREPGKILLCTDRIYTDKYLLN